MICLICCCQLVIICCNFCTARQGFLFCNKVISFHNDTCDNLSCTSMSKEPNLICKASSAIDRGFETLHGQTIIFYLLILRLTCNIRK